MEKNTFFVIAIIIIVLAIAFTIWKYKDFELTMPEIELPKFPAKKEEPLDEPGPGNCMTEEECDEFCSDINNVEQCINFYIEQGIMTQEQGQAWLEMIYNLNAE